MLTDPRKKRTFDHALLVCVLASRIHKTDKAVRHAAFRMTKVAWRPVAEIMIDISMHKRPLAFVEAILQEKEVRPSQEN